MSVISHLESRDLALLPSLPPLSPVSPSTLPRLGEEQTKEKYELCLLCIVFHPSPILPWPSAIPPPSNLVELQLCRVCVRRARDLFFFSYMKKRRNNATLSPQHGDSIMFFFFFSKKKKKKKNNNNRKTKK
jgi:hypothetical protein